jgi:hypothetical protein
MQDSHEAAGVDLPQTAVANGWQRIDGPHLAFLGHVTCIREPC